MSRPMRVKENQVHVRKIKRRVVVTAVPHDDLGFVFRCFEDSGLVHSGVDDDALIHERLIFLTLFNGALVFLEIPIG